MNDETPSALTLAIDQLEQLADASGCDLSSSDFADKLAQLELESDQLDAIAERLGGIDRRSRETAAGYMGHRAVDAIFEIICRLDQAKESGVLANTASNRAHDDAYQRIDSIVQLLVDNAERCSSIAWNGFDELLEIARRGPTMGYDRGEFAMPRHLLNKPSATAWCEESARSIERSIGRSTDDLTIRDAVVRLILGEARRCVRCKHARFRHACSSFRQYADHTSVPRTNARRVLDAARALAIHVTVRASLHQSLSVHLRT